MLTQTDINKLDNNNKSNQIHLSKTQLQSNKHLLSPKSKKKSTTRPSEVTETSGGQKSTQSSQSNKTSNEKSSTKDSDIAKLIDDYIRNVKVKD